MCKVMSSNNEVLPHFRGIILSKILKAADVQFLPEIVYRGKVRNSQNICSDRIKVDRQSFVKTGNTRSFLRVTMYLNQRFDTIQTGIHTIDKQKLVQVSDNNLQYDLSYPQLIQYDTFMIVYCIDILKFVIMELVILRFLLKAQTISQVLGSFSSEVVFNKDDQMKVEKSPTASLIRKVNSANFAIF